MTTINVLGMDYGASNGRGIVGRFDGQKLTLEEIHRFPNQPVSVASNLYWNILSLFQELKNSIIKAQTASIAISSIGIDTWGVDFGILDKQGNLLSNPHHYRDRRTENISQEVYKMFSEYELFSMTGMKPGFITTLFQLISMKDREAAILDKAETLLFMPCLLSYFLTGNINCEATQASTSLMYSPFTGDWITKLLEKYCLPDILPKINPSNHIIGNVQAEVIDETGIGKVPVISVAQHDTASAIASVPTENQEDVVYISCGTWSVLGTTISRPIISREVLESGFCNEIGYNNEIMFVKNITGLWILQECVRDWAKEGYKIDYEHMGDHALKSSFNSYIDVDYEPFQYPGNMTQKIIDCCKKLGQQPPKNKEEVYKCIIHGLAVNYKKTIEQLKTMTGKGFKSIHIVGGGSKDKALCQMTADLTGLEVMAGPSEATVVGNIMSQLIALGEIGHVTELPELIKNSFHIKNYAPR